MKEFFREKRGALALTLALGLGASALGSTTASAANKPKAPAVAKQKESESSGITEHVIYFKNGAREIAFSGSATNSDGIQETPSNIYEFCDGSDLVEESLPYNPGGFSDTFAGGMSIIRSVDYRGCTDGKLTPSDFQLHQNIAK